MDTTKKDQLGVGSIKAALLIIVGMVTTSIKNFADGIQASDFLALIPEAMKAATQANVFKNIGPEIKDGISQEQMQELLTETKKAFISADLGITNEAFVDALAAAVIEAAIANLKIVYLAREWKAEGASPQV